MRHELGHVTLAAFRSAPPGLHIAQCQGGVCILTATELITPGARYEEVPLSDIGAIHQEHDTTIVVDAHRYLFSLEVTSRDVRDEFAFCIAHLAQCNLFGDDGLIDKENLEKLYLQSDRHRTGSSHAKRMWPFFVATAIVLVGTWLLYSSNIGEEKPPQYPPAPTGQRTTWATDAKDFRERPRGQKLTFTCPSAGTTGTVYGTGIYTDDSSICTAAAHAGVITIAEGGKVTIILRGRQETYAGSTQNGVTSSDWNSPWNWSFEIENDSPRSRSSHPAISWSQAASDYSGAVGKRFTFICPPKGEAAAVYGTGVYTDDSSICTAGVHAGKITLEEGGTVTIVITDGASAFYGSVRNGIDSSDWSEWPRGFRIIS
jgi:hypothetical protein